MNNILIIDFSIYRDSLAKILGSEGYNLIICESAFEAMKKLNAYEIDLVVSEVELPGDNAFDLYNYMARNYPYIPVIMTTDKNIDGFFNEIFQEGIGNVLCKPVKKDELLNLAEKLITKKNIFGLNNYMDDIIEIKKITITSSIQIKKAITMLIGELEKWGFKIKEKIALTLVLNEIVINAIYHAHGHTEEKLARKSIELEDGEFVDIFFAKNRKGYGVAIDDYNGRLSKMRILESINKVVEQENLIIRAAETGEDVSDYISETGRGIDFVRKLSGEYYFIIKKDVRTEIIFIVDETLISDDCINYSSLKIIEDTSE